MKLQVAMDMATLTTRSRVRSRRHGKGIVADMITVRDRVARAREVARTGGQAGPTARCPTRGGSRQAA